MLHPSDLTNFSAFTMSLRGSTGHYVISGPVSKYPVSQPQGQVRALALLPLYGGLVTYLPLISGS